MKCVEALDCHHLDPNEKEFSFGRMRGNIISWARMVPELRKCVLLCRNCHGEVHYGGVEIPSDVSRFDESYVDYRIPPEKDLCPVCGNFKTMKRKFCSWRCANKAHEKVDWVQALDRYSVVKNFTTVANEFGCSANAVKKHVVRQRSSDTNAGCS